MRHAFASKQPTEKSIQPELARRPLGAQDCRQTWRWRPPR
jgi:hypothetical protein